MTQTIGSNSDKDYTDFLKRVNDRFVSNIDGGKAPLFKTDASDLWEIYLSGFDTPEERQHHNCNACKSFINHYGNLVTIDEHGNTKTAIWDAADAPPLYKKSLKAMAKAVNAAKVTSVFLSSEKNLGIFESNGWAHLSVVLPALALYRGRTKTAGQAMAAKREDYGILQRSIADYSLSTATKALDLLKSGTMYRPEIAMPVATFFFNLKTTLEGLPSTGKSKTKRDNIVWLAVAKSSEALTHVRSSIIGTVLDDVELGEDSATIAANWRSKTNSTVYQRAQVAPSQGQINQAEKLVEKLGVEPSLHRRYATLDELQKLWVGKEFKTVAHKSQGGVFGNIKPKGVVVPEGNLSIAGTTQITWDKFQRTVLADAAKMEMFVDKSLSNRFAALVTAQIPDSPPILQWDKEGDRNPFSWYYAAGIDAEAQRRVEKAGGQYKDNDLRVTLIWEDRHDLDLHVQQPNRETIFFGHKRSSTGGYLDVDMNIGGETTEPVENVRWTRGAPVGAYKVGVARYNSGSRRDSATHSPFTLEIATRGQVFRVTGVNTRCTGSSSESFVQFDFDGTTINNLRLLGYAQMQSVDMTADWNLVNSEFVPVTAVVASPNTWGGKTTQHGRHIFFTLEGCKDTTEGAGRGFFSEMLNAELKPIRATLEAFTAGATIAGSENANACGVGMSDQSPWNLNIRVTSNTGRVQMYKIDRWD